LNILSWRLSMNLELPKEVKRVLVHQEKNST
jgi:hypothetical protein